MPLPWKKPKTNRISRLVADLQSPKHGGSLVVEPGFPTSLIDLFMKHRDRMRKISEKKKTKNKKKRVVNGYEVSSTNTNVTSPMILSDSVAEIENPDGDGIVEKIVDSVDEVRNEIEIDSGVGNKRVFTSLLKVFIVIVLALVTTKLALWITVSAFVLWIVESIAERVLCFLKPCKDAQKGVDSLIQRSSSLVLIKRDCGKLRLQRNFASRALLKEKEENLVVSDCADLVQSLETSASVDNIEVEESDCNPSNPQVDQCKIIGQKFDFLYSAEIQGETELRVKEHKEDNNSEMEARDQRKIRSKLKLKLIKFFKQLRKQKMAKKRRERELELEPELELELIREATTDFEEDKVSMIEKQEIQVNENHEELKIEKIFPEPEKETVMVLEEVEGGVGSVCDVLQVNIETKEERGKMGRKRSGNYGYFLFLLIVLLGLVGGRTLAIGFTIGWYIVFKSVEALSRFNKILRTSIFG